MQYVRTVKVSFVTRGNLLKHIWSPGEKTYLFRNWEVPLTLTDVPPMHKALEFYLIPQKVVVVFPMRIQYDSACSVRTLLHSAVFFKAFEPWLSKFRVRILIGSSWKANFSSIASSYLSILWMYLSWDLWEFLIIFYVKYTF